MTREEGAAAGSAFRPCLKRCSADAKKRCEHNRLTNTIFRTPVECVDFILCSVDDILLREFGRPLTDEGVHILE